MWEIWANVLSPKALKNRPKSNKSPDLVTLVIGNLKHIFSLNHGMLNFNHCDWLFKKLSANRSALNPCSVILDLKFSL